MTISFPGRLKPYLFEKGSIAINGVSLTIGEVRKEFFEVYLIPHTLKLSNFCALKKGDKVNLETDTLVKFFQNSIF